MSKIIQETCTPCQIARSLGGEWPGMGGHHVTSGVQTPTIDRNYPLYGHLWTCHARVSLANRRLVFLRTAIKPGLFQLGVWNTASAEPIKAFYKFATWKSREMGQNRAEKGDRGYLGAIQNRFSPWKPTIGFFNTSLGALFRALPQPYLRLWTQCSDNLKASYIINMCGVAR